MPIKISALWGCIVVLGTASCDIADKLDKAKDEAKEASEEASKPKVGTECSGTGVFCKDKESMLECIDDKWAAIPCRGKKGCTGTTVVSCDHTIAKAGDACGKDENYSCTEDGKSQAKCVDGKWKQVAECRGPKACVTKFPFSNCDQSIVKEGDACEKDGNAACSEDASAVMECKSGKYGTGQKCAAGTKCVSEGIFVKCK